MATYSNKAGGQKYLCQPPGSSIIISQPIDQRVKQQRQDHKAQRHEYAVCAIAIVLIDDTHEEEAGGWQ